ncbi:hypothetical protein ES705_28147 [subsurface metagenome]
MRENPKIKQARKLLIEATIEDRAKRKTKSDNQICTCGHKFKDHTVAHSINFTGGMCTKCKCRNFLVDPKLQTS